MSVHDSYRPSGGGASHRYMKYRIQRILLVCSSYDGYILEEDGHIESQINREYLDLNLSNPPALTRVSSTAEALALLEEERSFDLILTMYNIGEPDVFNFGRIVREKYGIPVALLTSFSKDIYRRIKEQDRTGLDYIFCWHGNADLIIAIIKLIEDSMNAAEDIEQGGVQAILLVEDSIRFYSSYLPELYKLLLLQNTEFLQDAYNEQQQILRKRARPKVLLATNYEEAEALYGRYKKNLLGVISDVGFVMKATDKPEDERLDAGIELCRLIKEDNPLMPVVLQSSQTDFSTVAEELGAGFIAKNSKTLMAELGDFIRREFAFGDFIFKDPETGEEVGRAKDLRQMQEMIATIPDDAFEYHTSQNHLSKWLYSRGLFPLAASIRQYDASHFDTIEAHRRSIVGAIRDYRTLLGQGVIARFDAATYTDAIAFARIGEGSIGGKARGLAFMNSMLIKHHQYDKHEGVRILIPRSVVIATEYFDLFLQQNGLDYLLMQDYSDEEVLSEFVASTLPEKLLSDLRAYIRTVRGPLAVRSSSKLEDSHFQPFAGVYSTYMVPYTPNEDQMLRLVMRAIKSVYASVYFAESKAYIQTSQNLISEEKMAVILQEVCGTEQNGVLMPTFSGVARSINCYPVGDERAEDGVCNVAMGLGKLVVDGGRTLRFSPAYPQHVLQTSTPELALRETQNEVLALDLDPAAFRSSTDDGINLKHLRLTELEPLRHTRYVTSVWDRENERISDSPFDRGRRVITFNNILKYNTFPLAQIVSDMLRLGTEEMRCPVEVEFAVNMDVKRGEECIFNLLQIRPIIDNQDNRPLDWEQEDCSEALIYGEQALGIGRMNDLKHILYVKPETFSSLVTERVAEELLAINRRMGEEKKPYILVGPGRWGSSDPFLGVPAKWHHISEAKVIVECSIPSFEIEPSQGSHFFQNVTSLGVGYLTINPHRGDGIFRRELLDAMEAEYEGDYLRLVAFEEPLEVVIDGRSNRGMVKKS